MVVFCCVPDHRLRYRNHTIGQDAFLVTGVLDDPSFGTSTVTKFSVEVAYGTNVKHMSFG